MTQLRATLAEFSRALQYLLIETETEEILGQSLASKGIWWVSQPVMVAGTATVGLLRTPAGMSQGEVLVAHDQVDGTILCCGAHELISVLIIRYQLRNPALWASLRNRWPRIRPGLQDLSCALGGEGVEDIERVLFDDGAMGSIVDQLDVEGRVVLMRRLSPTLCSLFWKSVSAVREPPQSLDSPLWLSGMASAFLVRSLSTELSSPHGDSPLVDLATNILLGPASLGYGLRHPLDPLEMSSAVLVDDIILKAASILVDPNHMRQAQSGGVRARLAKELASEILRRGFSYDGERHVELARELLSVGARNLAWSLLCSASYWRERQPDATIRGIYDLVEEIV